MKGILVLLVLGISLLGACAGPSAPPLTTPAPSLPPEPTPTPTPSPPPQLPHYKITLVSFHGMTQGSRGEQAGFTGQVRNDSPVTLEDMEVVITIYDEDNHPLGVGRERVWPWVLLPGETGSTNVTMTNYVNAAIGRISFELPRPGILDLSVEPGVSTELWRPQGERWGY